MVKGFVEGAQIQEPPMGLQIVAAPGFGRCMLWGTELTPGVTQAASGADVDSTGQS
jgi:hypothetical protein